jgi:hypothetical protein
LTGQPPKTRLATKAVRHHHHHSDVVVVKTTTTAHNLAWLRLRLRRYGCSSKVSKVNRHTPRSVCALDGSRSRSRTVTPQGRYVHLKDHTPQLPPPHDRATSQSRSLKHAAVFPMNSLSFIARLVSSELSGRSRMGAG